MMAGIGFSDAVTTQLSLAELHGNLALSLEKISAYLENMRKVKKKLIELALILLSYLGFYLIMLGWLQLFAPSNGCTKYWYAIDQFLSPTLFGARSGDSGSLLIQLSLLSKI